MVRENTQIKIGALLSYFSIALNILSGLLYTPWMIEHIGQNEYGLYTLANSLISLFLIDFGLSSATARYLAKYHALGEEDKVDNFLGLIYKLYIFIDAIIFIVLIVVFVCIDFIYVKLTPHELAQFKVVYIIAALFSVINFPFVTLNGILTAYGKFIFLKLSDVIYRILVVGLMIVALINGYGLYAVVTVNAVVGLILIVYKVIVIRKTTNVKVNFKYSSKEMYREVFGFSLWSTVAALSQRLIFNITPSILGMVSNTAAIAIFGIVTTIEGYAYTLSSAINGMFLPRVSKIYTKEKAEEQILPLMMKVGRFQYALNGLIVAGFAVVGKEFILLWMGEKYISAYYGILLVTIPGLFFNSLQIANTAVVVTKHVNYYACINLGMGLCNVFCSLILSRYCGVVGACISIFIAYMIRAIALNLLYYKKLKIDIITFAKSCYIKMSIPIVLTTVIGMLLSKHIICYGWIGLGVKATIIIVVYGCMVFIFGIEKRKLSINKIVSFWKGLK